MTYDIIVIGGGASGMATAIMSAKRGMCTLVIENSDRVLKKVLATGNGKCNFSNVDVAPTRYNTPFVTTAIEQFGYDDAVAFFRSIGLLTACDDGRAYPYSRQASSVVFALMNEAERLGVRVNVGEKVTRIDEGFSVTTDKTKYLAKAVVLATGSNATSGLMSHDLLEHFNHKCHICIPSLTYLMCDKSKIVGLNGIRIKASATIKVKGKDVTRSGELLFKNNAISGIMIFELSSFFARREVDSDIVTLDIVPDMTKDELRAFLKESHGDTLTRLLGFLPKQLAILLNKMSNGDLDRAVDLAKSYAIHIDGLGDIKNSQVVSGGLAVEDFDSNTLESKKVANLYATGEVLDVDGECGGYNLHWAWASANLVAKSIGKKYGK